MTNQEKINEALSRGISLPSEITDTHIVCVYGFFAIKNNEEKCFYIGKATDLNDRMLSSANGHIHSFLRGDYKKLVPGLIKEFTDKQYRIDVRILEKVNYEDSCFSRAAHRLALAEYTNIVKYQNDNQCLRQYPEGIKEKGNEETYWKSYFKK